MINSPNQIVYTNKAKCRDCNRCVRECPVKAIKIENDQASIIQELCISCGTCVRTCPQNAKTYRKDIQSVLDMLDAGMPLAVSLAPSIAGFLKDWEIRRLASALRKCGFMHISETAIGAYYTAQKSKEYIESSNKRVSITTACPAVVTLVEKYFPSLSANLVPVVSPMIAHAKAIKNIVDKNLRVIFAGPCISKKYEKEHYDAFHDIETVITFDELFEILKIKGADMNMCEESEFDMLPGQYSRLFPLEGGLLKTAGLQTDSLSLEYLIVSGVQNIQEAFQYALQSKNKVIIEPLFCENGCINGPAKYFETGIYSSRHNVLKYDQKNAFANSVREPEFQLSVLFNAHPIKSKLKIEEDHIKEVLKQIGKFYPEDELNCGACGYSSCKQKAIAVLKGMAEIKMCLPYMRTVAEQKTDKIINSSPNGIVMLDDKLEIISMNPSFKTMFIANDNLIGKKISYLIDPDPFETLVSHPDDLITKTVHYASYNLICHQLHYAIREENRFVGIFVDITEYQKNKAKLQDIKTETVTQIQELIEHQIQMSQQLAKFLGENMAQGELLLHKLLYSIGK